MERCVGRKKMVDHIFREYDIRGKVGSELIVEEMYDLVRALVYFLVIKDPQTKTIALGIDGRVHSPLLRDAAVKAITDSGLNVLFLGVCPTPTLYFSQFTLPVQAGLMITASHNPAEYNGIKVVHNKESIWGKDLIEVRGLYKSKKYVQSALSGTCTNIDGVALYVDYLVDHFAHLRNMSFPVLIDCANAVGGVVFPQIIQKLNWKHVALLYDTLDGTFPNHEADPVVEDNMVVMQRMLASGAYEVGIGLDGDCDRMAPMTKSGYLVPGDQLLGLFSYYILQDNPGARIVFDVKASQGLIDLLNKWGAKPCMSACGHSIIKNEMKKQGAVLAGELSCHFCFKDRYFGYDDGIYAALRLLEILTQSNKSLDELISDFPRKYSSPEIRIACKEEQKKIIIDRVKDYFKDRHNTTILTIDGIRCTFDNGWGLIRASNTQSVLSLRFEGETLENLHAIEHEFLKVLQPFFSPGILEHHFFS